MEAPSSKLTAAQVATIWRWVDERRVLAPLAKRFGVVKAAIYNVANGFTYREAPLEPIPVRQRVGHYRRDAVHHNRKAGV
jgi:hypothetical protein